MARDGSRPTAASEILPLAEHAMKPAQWAVAAVLFAAMVFGLTFAMNYLQRPQPVVPFPDSGGDSGRDLELTFLSNKLALGGVEGEVGAPSQHDFWFVNDN